MDNFCCCPVAYLCSDNNKLSLTTSNLVSPFSSDFSELTFLLFTSHAHSSRSLLRI